MGGADKLAARVCGRPLLDWTLDAVVAARSVRRLIVVAAPEKVEEVRSAAAVRALGATVVAGGERRQQSVAAGLAAADGSVVLVHDAARPLVTPALVDRVALAAEEHGAAIPVLPVSETLKRVAGQHVVETVDRSSLTAAQTPQGARRDLLAGAFRSRNPDGPETFTDEASLLEAESVAVVAVPGEALNIKVTTPEDLETIEAHLARRLGPPRVGLGTDRHHFGPGDGLALAGIVIHDAPALEGHSDGDVALHAVADALLGAAGLGDLGRLFPAGEPRTRGIASSELVREVVQRVRDAGWRPTSVDVTIVAARPRLSGGPLEQMRPAVAALLGLPEDVVAVKASTGNLDGSDGAGRSISATAVASVVRRWPSS